MQKIVTFAAIDIGSYEVGMKIFELSSKGMREIDYIRYPMELGKDTYRTGKIRNELLDELCKVLQEFIQIMKGYKVDAYRACTTSAIRETDNALIVLEQIRVKTGIHVEVLSNSEQRFIGYKSIAFQEKDFNEIIKKGTAIIDVGGGSLQISLFDKDSLVTTQNIKLGVLRIREKLSRIKDGTTSFEHLVEELIDHEMQNFKKLYLKDREIYNIIAVGDYITYMIKKAGSREKEQNGIRIDKFVDFYKKISKTSPELLAEKMDMPAEYISLAIPAMIIYRKIIEQTGAEYIWTPGLNLCDGLAYDYAEKNNIIHVQHDFEEDILAAAKNISKRYLCNKGHIATIENAALVIFDGMKKIHGMDKRERLLLQIAAWLHDCGKYISLSNGAECGYNIIMATEIIGISHREREIVANVVKYNTMDFPPYEILAGSLEKKDYLLVAKLTAILRMANVCDRSHRQKFKEIRAVLKDKELLITLDTIEDISLERGMSLEKEEFFEEVFSVKPRLQQKKRI